jgi:hypothetical protein
MNLGMITVTGQKRGMCVSAGIISDRVVRGGHPASIDLTPVH